MAFLDLVHIEKAFGTTRVVKDFNLTVEKGEFVSFLGPSGCGKTTTLRMIAGFETPTSGSIRIDGREVTALKPNQRNIGMVFQSYALFPNLTVDQNVDFGMRVAGVDRATRRARVNEMLGIVGLGDFGARYPFQLSGGQQQRVALARALAVQPQVLLLDEPLSALDAKIRISLREEIRAIQRRLGITTIYVTHDQEEALSMSDRVVVMNQGRAEQVAQPFEIYNRPATRFVASFVGTLNTFEGEVEDPATGEVRLGLERVSLGRALPAGRVTLALRPEMLKLGGGEGRVTLPATVREVHFLGSVIRMRADVAGATVAFDTFNMSDAPPPEIGAVVRLGIRPTDILVLGD
ncbi:spermidine/putrescine ABC transporter ATP-binding protein [Haematobacter missouriensis]|uniref:ABC transporter ATP-binding protein n=1 Tax=Haematobacter missouriensis TaxID=366616 RepID=A0A212AYD5_9RHOB|nr:ABC transporter ATP-binding protein [Haematobacter missouriensis]KFI27292.1 spermidine/putrescine ABC transporter ATP-binding protein [Haematobacter missouriensis]OWJ77539.1 ABC transporter ATP-binding protein [Haematobacter missouriensis]OWJ86436.1 ABC transporter ATP-binding protein [Haematobacter missouriensis]